MELATVVNFYDFFSFFFYVRWFEERWFFGRHYASGVIDGTQSVHWVIGDEWFCHEKLSHRWKIGKVVQRSRKPLNQTKAHLNWIGIF